MKTKTNGWPFPKTILLVLLAGFVAGVVCSLCFFGLRPRQTSPSTSAAGGPSNTGSSAESVVALTGQKQVLVQGLVPIQDAKDASTRAAMAANEQARSMYGIEPFADSTGTATFDGNFWSWRKRVGYGHGDLEAEVRLAPSGRVDWAIIHCMTQQAVNRFRF